MRVRLKGLNCVRIRLADGTHAEYFYAWKGGPRLTGKPGTPEFLAAYHAAVSARKAPPPGTLLTLLQGYQASDRDFLSKAPRTRADYIKQIKLIERDFGDFPLSALNDRRTRGEFMAWRDKLALRSRRQADYAWTVLARVLSWAKDRGLITINPCERGGRLYRGSRADKVWTDDDEAAFYASAPKHLHLPVLLALWTGQREGDLLRLTWHCYDGQRIRLQQSKTKARVVIPVGRPLKLALDALDKRGERILLNSRGKPWDEDGFRSSFNKARKRAGIEGVTFNDLRGTAVTRLAIAGCSEAEIATITGHSLRDVRAVLDASYLHRDPIMGESAIRKLEARTKFPK